MFSFRFLSSFLVYSITLCVLAVSSLAQQGNIEKLIEDASVDSQKGAIFNYTYTMELSYDKKKTLGVGRKFTKTYKAIIPSRFPLSKNYTHPLVLIKDSEKLVTQDHINDSIKRLITEVERAENAAGDPLAESKETTGGYWTMRLKTNRQGVKIDVLRLLGFSRFSNLQQKKINGNDIISIDFFPELALVFDDSLTYITKIEGQIWIDAASKRIIRIEGYPLGFFKNVRDKTEKKREEKAVFLFIQTKVPEGFWFPKYVALNFKDHPNIFKPIKLEFKFSDYKKSNTDVRNVNIRQPDIPEEEEIPQLENSNEEEENN